MQQIHLQRGEGYEFIAYLDDDDQWLPEKLERQLARFNKCDENVAMVYCNGIRAETGQEYLGNKKLEGNLYNELLRGDFIGTFTGPLLRIKCLEAIGGFDEQMKAHQDYETWIRLSQRYSITFIDEVLFRKHNNDHGEQISSDLTRYIEARERIFHKNEDYLLKNTITYYAALSSTVYLCIQAGKPAKSFSFMIKAVKLRPLSIRSNIILLLRTVYRVIKHKLKGEE